MGTMGVPTALLLIDACQSCPEVTWSRVRGLFVFAAARGDLRPEPGLGHCFLGPAAPLVSAVLGCRPFPSCSGLSDGGECGESGGGIQEPPQVLAPAGNSVEREGSLRGTEVGGSQGRQGSQKWDCVWSRRGNMRTCIWIWSTGWSLQASC